jgi:hypothetical protein
VFKKGWATDLGPAVRLKRFSSSRKAKKSLTMDNPFFDHPILNSPYVAPQRHWELDSQGQPTQRIIENRRRAEFITPIPRPKKRKKKSEGQQEIVRMSGR